MTISAKPAITGNDQPLAFRELQWLEKLINSEIGARNSQDRKRNSGVVEELTLIRDKLIYLENETWKPINEETILHLNVGEKIEYKMNGSSDNYVGRVLASKPEKFKVQPLYYKSNKDIDLSVTRSIWLLNKRYAGKVTTGQECIGFTHHHSNPITI